MVVLILIATALIQSLQLSVRSEVVKSQIKLLFNENKVFIASVENLPPISKPPEFKENNPVSIKVIPFKADNSNKRKKQAKSKRQLSYKNKYKEKIWEDFIYD